MHFFPPKVSENSEPSSFDSGSEQVMCQIKGLGNCESYLVTRSFLRSTVFLGATVTVANRASQRIALKPSWSTRDRRPPEIGPTPEAYIGG